MDTNQQEKTEIGDKQQVVLKMIAYPQMYRIERLVDADSVEELKQSDQFTRFGFYAHLGSLADHIQDIKISLTNLEANTFYSEFN
jgi:hypothetical protein